MVRFRPTKLFRRLSSRGDTSLSPTTSNSSPPPPSSSPLPAGPPASSPPKLPVHAAASPKGVRKSRSLPKLRRKLLSTTPDTPPVPLPDTRDPIALSTTDTTERNAEDDAEAASHQSERETLSGRFSRDCTRLDAEEDKQPQVHEQELQLGDLESVRSQPILIVQQATPDVLDEVKDVEPASAETSQEPTPDEASETDFIEAHTAPADSTSPSPPASSPAQRGPPPPTDTLIRRPSILDSANANLVKALLDSPFRADAVSSTDSFPAPPAASRKLLPSSITDLTAMVHRKIWVKRPGASPTLIQIREDDLVDDVREMILRKYANSLGKTFDAPDMTLSIASRAEQGTPRNEHVLGPEEEMCRTIDTYYPGGQTVHEALVISVPQRRTPRPSPKFYANPTYQALDDYRPLENGTDYFPPMPALIPSSIPQTSGSHDSRSSQHHHSSVAAPSEPHPRSISVINTGQIPPLPSPGRRHQHQHRPKYHRQPTSSPTILSHPAVGTAGMNPSCGPVGDPQPRAVHRQSTRPRMDSAASEHVNGIPAAPPALPTPPAADGPLSKQNNSQPPTPSGIVNNAYTMNLHQPQKRPRKTRKTTPEDKAASVRTRGSSSNNNNNTNNPNDASPALGTTGGGGTSSISSALESAAVPPINVLIVEDNVINLKILEGLMKRLKVRWQTAMNGQIAVDKYRAGGFHLVLMDIQMPVMNGLQATKEIRRLERVNGIGVFGEVSDSPLAKSGHLHHHHDENHHNGGSGGGGGVNGNGVAEGQGESNGSGKDSGSDKLQMSEGLFKSPVIIVALTASSLQSDRHEALAAGCNDFLTKPVNFVWLERKVKEWGCMQALIDYDGWRKWKDYAAQQEAGKTAEEKAKDKEREEKDRVKAEKMAKLQEKQAKLKEERDKKKRSSLNASEVAEAHEENGDADASTPATSAPSAVAAPATESSAANAPTEALRSGAQCLKDASFDLG